MLTIPFLSDLDPQAAIKGSRDPLGVQSVWARLGRHIVGNLTTVTNSVRGFTTVMLGYYFAERVANDGGGDGNLQVFLRWEQLAAYARAAVNDDWAFLGVRRVKRALNDGDGIRLSAQSAAQILSNQKTYGLWGLYTVSARASGLLENEPTRLTVPARELVDDVYLPIFGENGFRNAEAVVERLAKPRTEIDRSGRDRRLVQTVAKVLSVRLSADERRIYRDHLLLGGPQDHTAGRQAILAKGFEDTLDAADWQPSPSRVRHLAKRSRAAGPLGDSVAERLEHIRTAELLLAPAVRLFSFLLASEGQALVEVAKTVRRQWGASVRTIDLNQIRMLEPELRDASGDAATGKRWVKIAEALTSGDYVTAMTLLMEQNQFVMKARGGGAAWADMVDGRLRVKFRDENAGGLPEAKELPELWVHPYFLDSLRAIALALRA